MLPGAPAAESLETYRRQARGLFYRKADVGVTDAVLQRLPEDKARFGAEAEAQIAAVAAEALGTRSTTASFVPDAGTFHALFRLGSPDGDRWYARTSVPSLGLPALGFAVEMAASHAAAARGVPTARIVHVDLSRRHLPVDLQIAQEASGTPLGRDASPDVLEALGRTIARLHAIRCSGFGPLDPEVPPGDGPLRGLRTSWPEFVRTNLDEHVAHCRRLGALSPTDAAFATTCLRDAALLTTESVLLHGDLANPNVLVEGAQVHALLDWEDALAGDPVFDLACWGTFVGNHERRAAMLRGYRSVTTLPDDFEFRYWLYHLRIMLAKTVHRSRFGYVATDRIPAGDRLRPALTALRDLTRGHA